jgi:hypothetical protein
MDSNLYFKYYLLLLLSLNVCSFNLINSIRNVRMSSYSSTNSYLDNLNKNNILKNKINDKLIDVKNNNFQNMSLSPKTLNTNKIKSNTLFFNIYNVDDLFVDRNFTKIILNLKKGNSSVYYINENNELEQIISSSQMSSNKIKNIVFTDLNKIMDNALGFIYDDTDNV